MNQKHRKNLLPSKKELTMIWEQVPPDYYQEGVSNNILQRIWHTRKKKVVITLIKRSGVTPGSILDVGSASGWFLNELVRPFPKAKGTGVDVYKKAIDFGNNTYKHLRLVRADAHALPFKDNSFDVVVCCEVLEHVVSPEKVLTEIKRVLKPTGVAIIEMDSGNILFKIIWYWWTHILHGVWKDAHIQSFHAKKLENMIRNTGFIIRREKTFNLTMAVAYATSKS